MSFNISFYVAEKRIDKRGLAPIYAQVTIKTKNYPVQVEKIKPRYWNKITQRVTKNRQNEADNRHKEINSYLDRLSKDTSRLDRFANYKSAPQREEVKSILLNINPEAKPFDEAYEEFIETNRNKVSYNTSKNRTTAKNFIYRYQKHYQTEIQFTDIDLSFFEKLYDYAIDIEEKETNTFVTYVAKFKAFLNWGVEKKYINTIEYKKYTCSEKEKTIICLSPDEFKQLYNKEFESAKLDKARDLYCFGCLTGLRYSDIRTLRREHIHNGYISKNITKTQENDYIPILPQAQEILDKYKNESIFPLPKLSNQKLNDYIKDCCEKAEINTPTIKLIYKGNEKIEKVFPKYKLITAHTSRKTFITIAFILGMDVKIIKSITGHKKDSTFDKYLKLADEMKKEKMISAWSKL